MQKNGFIYAAVVALILIGAGIWYFQTPQTGISDTQIKDLFAAIETGQTEYVNQRLMRGVPADTQNSDGVTLLCHAARTGQIKTVRLLLEAGANEKGGLKCAALRGQAAVVRYLSKFLENPTPPLKCRFPVCRRKVPPLP